MPLGYYLASGGTIGVAPGGGCPNWTAVSDSPWLTITAGASGSGNGTVSYSVTRNSAGAQRTAVVAVGDATFTLTQGSDPCVLVTPSGLSAISPGTGNRLTWHAVAGTQVGGPIKAIHIIEARAALNEALTAPGLPLPLYADPVLTAGTPVRAVHVQQLRDAMR